MRYIIVRVELLALVVLSLFAHEGAARITGGISMVLSPFRSDSQAVTIGKFIVMDEQGKRIDLAALKGKVLFINFWALTCVPCKVEMPTINKLRERFKNDTDMLFFEVDLNNDVINSPKYMLDKGFGLGVYYAASAVPQALFRGELPTTVIVDKNGRIVYFHEGEDDYGDKKFVDIAEGLLIKTP